jgi:hypothetical protein
MISQTLSLWMVIHKPSCIIIPIIHSSTKLCSVVQVIEIDYKIHPQICFRMFFQQPVISTITSAEHRSRRLPYPKHSILSHRSYKYPDFDHNNFEGNRQVMCQILPFTLPCCRRTYVEVSKLPSCPESWPQKKCPAELCIQVRYEAEDRDAGACWRCQAERAGVLGDARENLRPEIDSAMIVHGFDEAGVEAENPDDLGKKRQRHAGGKKAKDMKKKIEVKLRNPGQPQTPAFSYPDPSHPSHWQNSFPAPYSNMSFSAGYELTQGSNMTDVGVPRGQPFLQQATVTGINSLDSAAIQNENSDVEIGQGSGQNCTELTPALGQQAQPLLNGPPCQYQLQYPDGAPDVKLRIQPKVRPVLIFYF